MMIGAIERGFAAVAAVLSFIARYGRGEHTSYRRLQSGER